MKDDDQHGCGDRCRSAQKEVLAIRRFREQAYVYPPDDRPVLPMLRHRCGPWCAQPDTGGPVMQGRPGESVSRELRLSAEVVDMLRRLRQ